jgi:phosphate transport system substrate-binding protein
LNDDWPDEKLNLFGPGVDSGTFDYFTRVITGKEGWSRGDYTSSEDDNILVSGVSSDRFALGFFSYVYYFENMTNLKLVAVDDLNPENGPGPVGPDSNTIGSDYQPLSRPVFIYIRKDALGKPGLSTFVEFYLRNAKRIAREVGFVPLSDKAYHLVLDRFRNQVTGSMFQNLEFRSGFSVEDILLNNSNN